MSGRLPQTNYGFGTPGSQVGGQMSTGPNRAAMAPKNDLANEINQQPLPYDQTPEYQQMQQMIAQQNAALGTYGSQVAGLQNQLTRMSSADPTKLYMRQLQQMYGQDPLAAYRGQIQQMYNPIQHMNWAVPLYGFENTWSG